MADYYEREGDHRFDGEEVDDFIWIIHPPTKYNVAEVCLLCMRDGIEKHHETTTEHKQRLNWCKKGEFFCIPCKKACHSYRSAVDHCNSDLHRNGVIDDIHYAIDEKYEAEEAAAAASAPPGRSFPYTCSCGARLESAIVERQHLKGKVHRAAPKAQPPPTGQDKKYCQLCGVKMASEAVAEAHLKGARHQKNLQRQQKQQQKNPNPAPKSKPVPKEAPPGQKQPPPKPAPKQAPKPTPQPSAKPSTQPKASYFSDVPPSGARPDASSSAARSASVDPLLAFSAPTISLKSDGRVIFDWNLSNSSAETYAIQSIEIVTPHVDQFDMLLPVAELPTAAVESSPLLFVGFRSSFRNHLLEQDGVYIATVKAVLFCARLRKTISVEQKLRYEYTNSTRAYLNANAPFKAPPRAAKASDGTKLKGQKPSSAFLLISNHLAYAITSFVAGQRLEYKLPLKQYKIPRQYFMGARSLNAHLAILRKIPPGKEKLHALMYAEEHRLLEDLSEYDMENVALTKAGGFGHQFRLLVPGLAENRPSVLKGDSFIASYSDGTSSMRFQGFVHLVEREHVVLDFHTNFRGDKRVNVTFRPSRLMIRKKQRSSGPDSNTSQIRRYHQAIDVAYDDVAQCTRDFVGTTGRGRTLLPLGEHMRDLNPEQKRAVQRILSGEHFPAPYIVFGPPGTGKTRTISHAIFELVSQYPNTRILAATPSNSAADEVSRRLGRMGLQRRHLFRLNAVSRTLPVDQELERLWSLEGPETIESRCQQAKVIVVTCASAGQIYAADLGLNIFLDEVGQCTEPEWLVPLQLLGVSYTRIVMAGDPKQLGPIVRSPVCKHETNRLDLSKLEQLMETCQLYARDDNMYNEVFITKLVKNYRAHQDLLTLPSRLFYDGELERCAAPAITDRFLHWAGLPCPGVPLIFHGVVGQDERENSSPSWFNVAEANCVLDYLKTILALGVKPAEIAIITPYLKQKLKIRLGVFNECGREVFEQTMVGSVEELQGQERQVIIISTVRSTADIGPTFDAKFNLGFLRDPKRFNVSITRAQALLIVIGNPHILQSDPHWGDLVRYAVAKKACAGVRPVDDTSTFSKLMKFLGSFAGFPPV